MNVPSKRVVEGVMVKLLYHKETNRGMTLSGFTTRCVKRDEIHELVITDEIGKMTGERVERVGFLGFVEIAFGGVIEIGDDVRGAETSIGRVIGFDECHFPNHYNILIAASSLVTATELELHVEDKIVFYPCSQQRR